MVATLTPQWTSWSHLAIRATCIFSGAVAGAAIGAAVTAVGVQRLSLYDQNHPRCLLSAPGLCSVWSMTLLFGGSGLFAGGAAFGMPIGVYFGKRIADWILSKNMDQVREPV